MSLADSYKQFLAAPNASLLANEASIHYVTTTTTIQGTDDIVKHFKSFSAQLRRKKEEFLNVVEGRDRVIAVEVDTVIEFLTGGGPYLPGLDDNFLADRVVYLPIVCIAVPAVPTVPLTTASVVVRLANLCSPPA